MYSLEPSAVSKSVTEASNAAKSMLLIGRSKRVDIIFPLFDQMNTTVRFYKFFAKLVSFFFFLQSLALSLWPFNPFYASTKDRVNSKLPLILQIFWFIDAKSFKGSLVASTIVIGVFTALIMFALGFQLFYYSKKRTFIRWTLYVTKVLTDLVTPILIFPIACQIGTSTLILLTGGSSLYWLYLIVGVICLVFILLLFYVVLMINSRTVIISDTPFLMHHPKGLLCYTFSTVGLIIATFVMSVYPKWIVLVLEFVHMIFLVIAAIYSSKSPFLDIKDNILFTSFVANCMILDLLLAVLFFFKGMYSFIPWAVAIGSVCLNFAIFSIVFVYKRNTIKKLLTYPSPTMNDNDKMNYLETLNLTNSPSKALNFLYIGLSEHCDFFVDMSLTTYLARNILTNQAISCLAQTTAFFPGENRKLNSLFKVVTSHRDIDLANRFMIFQLHRIRTLRASSTSTESNDLLGELRNWNQKTEQDIRSFWSIADPKISFCEKASERINNTSLMWNDALYTYPNNSKVSYEYSRFLSESLTDFDNAIYQQHRGDLIESGKNFAVDNSFRSFVHMFPSYLLDEILDQKGTRINKKSLRKGTCSQSSNNSDRGSNKFSSSDFSIDADLEEQIGYKILISSKMRMALHHSIGDRKSPYRRCMFGTSLFTLIATIGAFVGIYIYMLTAFSIPLSCFANIKDASNMRFYQDISIMIVWTQWGIESKRINNLHLLESAIADDVEGTFNFIDTKKSLPFQTMTQIKQVKESMKTLISSLSSFASTKISVYEYATVMIGESCSLQFCSEGTPTSLAETSFKDKLAYMMYLNSILTANTDFTNTYSSSEFCELITNSYTFVSDLSILMDAFVTGALVETKSIDEIFSILEIALIVCLFSFTFFPIIILNLMHIHSTNKVLRILSSLDAEVKENARKPIRNDIELEDSASSSEFATGCSSAILQILVFVLLTGSISVLFSFYIRNMRNANNQFGDFYRWYTEAVKRLGASGEATFKIMQIIILNESFKSTFTNLNHSTTLFQADIQSIMDSHQALTGGTNELDPFFGFDDKIDQLHFAEQCTVPNSSKNVHDIYRCASIAQQIAMFRDFSEQIISMPGEFTGAVDEPITLNLYHLMTSHLWFAMSTVCDRFVLLTDNTYQTLTNESIIFLCAGILISVIIVLYTYVFVNHVDSIYSTTISMIKHIRPIDIVASKPLMDFLLNRKSSDEKTMGISQGVVHTAVDAIICTGLNGTIEIVNPAISLNLGYTPEQLLGQPVTGFFLPEHAEQITKQIELMINGQSAPTFEDHLICLSDSAFEVSFHTTIIGMKGENSNSISSFVFILSNETERLKQQKEAEEAKAKSEKLLYQILPKQFVVRLNRGEKDISCSIPHATICFIDIVKFSDYTASLTPQEIMGNLSTVFSSFDSIILKYPRLIKIKLIGDVYMAAGGLFGAPDDTPNGHAEDMVKFAIECLGALDDINIKLSASLEIRIGINTGGPIFEGVLGTDKPVFDIIGDPINIAARLQSTDIPGRIQISSATKELIDSCGFSIEERGEVYLKGKGHQMTYLVSAVNAFLSIQSLSNLPPQTDSVN